MAKKQINTDKEMIQSYIFTMARYTFNVYEKRILYRLVEMCQMQLKGQNLNDQFRIDPTLFGDHKITIPISSFLKDEQDENYDRVKKALEALNNKKFEIDDGNVWQLIRLIEKPKFERSKGIATFELQPPVYEAILNFSKGFRKFELNTAFMFESVYAMRFYEMFSGKRTPVTYKVDYLKEIFGVKDKYSNFNDFVRKVIKPAQKELDKKAAYSFDFEYNSPEHKKGRKVVKITFTPRKIEENASKLIKQAKALKEASANQVVSPILVAHLKDEYGFNDTEIKNNYDLLNKSSERFNVIDFINLELKDHLPKKKNPKGYIISSIKNELKNFN